MEFAIQYTAQGLQITQIISEDDDLVISFCLPNKLPCIGDLDRQGVSAKSSILTGQHLAREGYNPFQIPMNPGKSNFYTNWDFGKGRYSFISVEISKDVW